MTHAFIWTTLPATLAWHSPQPALQGTTTSHCSAASGEGVPGISQVSWENQCLITRVSNLKTLEDEPDFLTADSPSWGQPRCTGTAGKRSGSS